jgi:hypothetical protein
MKCVSLKRQKRKCCGRKKVYTYMSPDGTMSASQCHVRASKQESTTPPKSTQDRCPDHVPVWRRPTPTVGRVGTTRGRDDEHLTVHTESPLPGGDLSRVVTREGIGFFCCVIYCHSKVFMVQATRLCNLINISVYGKEHP